MANKGMAVMINKAWKFEGPFSDKPILVALDKNAKTIPSGKQTWLLNMAIESAWIYPLIACWIFPSFFVNVYQAG
jgi:hypothetical protein